MFSFEQMWMPFLFVMLQVSPISTFTATCGTFVPDFWMIASDMILKFSALSKLQACLKGAQLYLVL